MDAYIWVRLSQCTDIGLPLAMTMVAVDPIRNGASAGTASLGEWKRAHSGTASPRASDPPRSLSTCMI